MGNIAAQVAMTVASKALAGQAQKKQAKRLAAYQAAQTEQTRRQFEMTERRRKEQLKRSPAAQRARLGASGTGLNGGSNRALLDGLAKLAETESAEARERLGWQLGALNRRNLLQQERLAAGGGFDVGSLLQKTLPTAIDFLRGSK